MLPEFLLPRRPARMDWPAKPSTPARRRRWDWRAVVGGAGRTMIGAGVLLFGFVGYQLWGTGIQQARSQDKLGDQFTQLLRSVATTTPTVPATTAGPATTEPPLSAATTSTATATATATTAPPQARTPPEPGDPIGRLVIPAIGVNQLVVSGVGTEQLKRAPGHYPDTPMPGEIGNAAIAGHRSTFGAPFARVDELAVGDEIDVTTAAGRFVYRVTELPRVVEPTEVGVIGPTPDAVLTLTSCWPRFSADKRIIVRARLDASASPAAVPPAPTTTPPAAAPQPVVGGTAATTLPGEATDTTTSIDGSTDATAATASTDAFRQGWWSDEAAWGDVVLWGTGLTAVALAAWWVSRRTTRNWLGALVGLGPFVVVLYFFYENAARLLPPNI